MGWRLAADATVVVHFAFVLFVAIGFVLVWKWGWVAALHLPVAVYGVVIELVGFRCPLTPLEKHFRRRAQDGGYEGGFVEHYLLRVLYPGRLTAGVRLTLAALVFVLNLAGYAWLWRRHRDRRREPTPTMAGPSSR